MPDETCQCLSTTRLLVFLATKFSTATPNNKVVEGKGKSERQGDEHIYFGLPFTQPTLVSTLNGMDTGMH